MRRVSLFCLLFATACAESGSDGIGVDVVIAGQTMAQSITTSAGGSVTLDPSYVALASAELVRCDGLALTAAMPHGESSPTNLAVPAVVAIAGARATIEVGTLEPPPGRYCGLALAIGAADVDALRIPDQDMIGKSLRVAGEHQGVPFAVSSAASGHAHLELAEPLDLSAESLSATLTVSLDTSAAFDAVDFDAVTAAADIIDGLAAGFHLSLQ